MRQLVELQLGHTPEIKNTIDRAWGVSQNKHKKKDAASAPPEASDPQSRGQLQLLPMGQDLQKKRFWAGDGPCAFFLWPDTIFVCICRRSSLNYFLHPDFGFIRWAYVFRTFIDTHSVFCCRTDSPRLYVSTNPWKITATFQTVSSTREEYLAVIEDLKAATPPEPKKGDKRSKMHQSHLNLIDTLESRIEAIDAELVVS